MDLSTYARDATISALFLNVGFTPVATLHLAFYSSDCGRAGTSGTDITTSIRAAGRLAVASSSWSAITANGNARFINNAAALSLGNAAASITNAFIGIWTQASGGNFITRVSAPFTVTSGQPYTIGVNSLNIEFP